jgi:phosphoribosylaminoimidazolecarboxamide formyltransferase/IMP cyclohydrolase
MVKIKTALLSVADKTGLPEYARHLADMGVKLLATAGTYRLLAGHDLPVEELSGYTGFPDILDGLVKTMHPKVHAGLLARRDRQQHVAQLREHDIEQIDMVVVNLYPFDDTFELPGPEPMSVFESIDTGGATLIRSAGKNYTHVAVVTNPVMYDAVVREMQDHRGALSGETLCELAREAFSHTARYDAAVARYLEGIEGRRSLAPERLILEFARRQELRYGENPQQASVFYVEDNISEPCVANARQVAGPVLSFNNILDINAGIELAKEFDRPAAVLVKHTNPCGAATANRLRDAFLAAYRTDPRSASGCSLVLNRPLGVHVAAAIAEVRAEGGADRGPFFLESLVAPQFDEEALGVLGSSTDWFTRTRMLRTGALSWCDIDEHAGDYRRVTGGLLVQERDLVGFDPHGLETPTRTEPGENQLAEMRLAWLVCKHARSNAVVLARERATVGLGLGQMNYMDATELALRKAGERAEGAVLACDAFLDMPAVIDAAAEAGVSAIVQPGGGPRDQELVQRANHHGLAMVFTGSRHFRH